jgi:CRP-like cAMP-binding protein
LARIGLNFRSWLPRRAEAENWPLPFTSQPQLCSIWVMSSSLTNFKQSAIINTLRACQLFAGLPPHDLEKIAAVSVSKSLAKGDYLFRERDRAHGFYAVQSGAVNVHRVNAAGKEQFIHIFRPGETFAEAALATEQGYPADACAVEPSQVLLIQKDGFLDLLRRQPELALRMLASMSSHLRVLVSQLEDLALKDVETRLANWLVKRCPNPKSLQPFTIELPTTKRVLAAELGTVSETLSRTLAKLREQKLLIVAGKKVVILSPARLNALLRQNLGEANFV